MSPKYDNLKIVGFTIVRNALKYDFPVVESIRSILPVCDEVVVAVGQSEDETLDLIKKIKSPKIRIIETIWDDELREGGRVLAAETNKALDAIIDDADWCFYIQADEVLHEQYYEPLRQRMSDVLYEKEVEGLLFDYLHFYGSYDYVGDSRKWYRNEIRVIRNDKRIRSYRDAQGFRKDGRKLKVKLANATMYHYGWVKHPDFQQLKRKDFHKLWYDDDWVEEHFGKESTFDYSKVDSLKRFDESHPHVMLDRVARKNWPFSFDKSQKKYTLKNKLLMNIEQWTGYRLGEYKNYVLLK